MQEDGRSRYTPRKRFEDNKIRVFIINIRYLEQMTVNQSRWKKVIYESSKTFETRRMKRDIRKQELTPVSGFLQLEYDCYNYKMFVCLKPDLFVIILTFRRLAIQQPTRNFCNFCDKVYESIVGFRCLMRVHGDHVNGKDS